MWKLWYSCCIRYESELPSRLPFSVKRSSSHSKYFVDKERQAKWGNVIYRMSQKGFLWDASKNCCFLCFKKQANYLSVAKTNMSIDKLIPLLFFFCELRCHGQRHY